MKQKCEWGVLWRQRNHLEGNVERLMSGTFRTKREAQEFIRERYGYIAKRPDLKREPHGWKMPLPVKVVVTVERADAA